MKLKIGHVYKFNYQKLHDVQTVTDSIEARLTDKALTSLIKDLADTAAEREEYFIKSKTDNADYLKDLKKLETLKSKRIASGKKQKTEAEKELEESVAVGKQTLLFDNKKETRKNWKARNLFIRNFIPEQISNLLDLNKEIEDAASKRNITAVYGGQYISANGKIVHTWYLAGWATLNKAYIKGLEQYLLTESY